MTRPMLSDAEIKRRKKAQATTSRITGGIGLAALGATGLATRPGQKMLRGGFKRIDRPVPKRLRAKPRTEKDLNNTVAPMLATSAGLGALGSFNFARYTEAESRKRNPVSKRSPFEDGFYGVVAKAADYDPEEKRMKRSKVYEATTGAAGGVMAVEGGIQGYKTGKKLKRLPKNDVVNFAGTDNRYKNPVKTSGKAYKAIPAKSLASAARSGRNTALLAGGSAAAFTASNKIREKRKSDGSWSPYAR